MNRTQRLLYPCVHVSERALRLGTEAAIEVFAAARRHETSGSPVLHLEIGEPGVPTPGHIMEAAVRSLREGETGYGPPAGLPDLRVAIAEHLRERGVPATPDRVVVGPGAKPLIFFAALTLLDTGDEALVPDPGFPIYASAVRAAGARPVSYAVPTEPGATFDVGAVAGRVTRRTRVLFVNSPHNPTGTVLRSADLAALATLAERHDLAVVSDDVYSRIRFDRCVESIAALPGLAGRTVLVDGFSKTYAMTGWRLGYAHLPPELVQPITRFVINSVTCTPAFVQRAGLAALGGAQTCVEELVSALAERRDETVARLNALPGVRCPQPAGTFYAFPRIEERSGRVIDDEAFARRLLDNCRVALLPGSGFGAAGRGHVRLSFAARRADLDEALARIGRFASRVRTRTPERRPA